MKWKLRVDSAEKQATINTRYTAKTNNMNTTTQKTDEQHTISNKPGINPVSR
jgi:hypothetical protein